MDADQNSWSVSTARKYTPKVSVFSLEIQKNTQKKKSAADTRLHLNIPAPVFQSLKRAASLANKRVVFMEARDKKNYTRARSGRSCVFLSFFNTQKTTNFSTKATFPKSFPQHVGWNSPLNLRMNAFSAAFIPNFRPWRAPNRPRSGVSYC